jgi:hypothetical protein
LLLGRVFLIILAEMRLSTAAPWLLLLLAAAAHRAAAAPCRDRFLQPFAVDSLWNTAIGDAATFVAANIYHPMPPARGCALRINSASRRRQCPGTGPTPSQQVGG